MGRINVLEKHIAELIAAGEVVERPSSVIKELVENAIDAGATAVTVEIQNGGVTMMRVSDNGSGILRSDVRNAFKRHATSKVSSKEDLDAIGTLGFRGEALASICAVAKVELLTKAKEEDVGTHYVIEGGDEVTLEDAGCPNGTTFIVRDLFYNVPARMKFLKKNTSEATAVAAVVDKIALSHSEVAITFIRDNKRTLTTAGDGSDKNCSYSVLGREFINNAISVDYELGGVTVKGFVTKPQAARASRAMQNFFINGRFVKSRTAMAALEEACKGMVMVGKFPGCVLYIGIPCSLVDVNVHPAKIEVRFVNERPVFEAVYHAVRSALIDGDTVKQFKTEPEKAIGGLVDRSVVKKPFTMSQFEVSKIESIPSARPGRESLNVYRSILEDTRSDVLTLEDSAHTFGKKQPEPQEELPPPKPPRSFVSLDIDTDDEPEPELPPPVKIAEEPEAPEPEVIIPQEEKTEEIIPEEKNITQDAPVKEEQEIAPLTDVSGDAVRFIGEAFKTYIIIEKNNELVFIDKHALHERIIYEKLRREQGKKYAQFLLEPVAVTLSKPQHQSVVDNMELFSESGFELDDFGGSTVLVRSAPSFIDAFDVAATIEEMADHILENKKNIESEYTDWLYHNIACRSAIKGGDKSSPQELVDLYIKMGESPDYRYCPHGRPTSMIMTRYQIEKQFGRV